MTMLGPGLGPELGSGFGPGLGAILLAQSRNAFDLIDLTHPQELLQLGQSLLPGVQQLLGLLALFGLIFAILGVAYRSNRPDWLDRSLGRYGQLWFGVQHLLLVLTLMILGFMLCSTLANRYHYWEQAKISQIASSVAGDRFEQPAPQVTYFVNEPYTTITYINGKPTEVEKERQVTRYLALTSSQADVKLSQTQHPARKQRIYQSTFQGRYRLVNPLQETIDFTLEATPPIGYSLLQDYRVDRDGQPLIPTSPGAYRFPIRLAPNEATQLQVSYKALGSPRWVFDAQGRPLSEFSLSILADFPGADFASDILPTTVQPEGQGTRFSWVFKENVSVQNPFGVFTATERVTNTGVLPRLLLLAPAILLWWLLLLYVNVRLELRDVAIVAAVLFSCLLLLTYGSRLMDVKLVWGLLLPLPLLLGWGLGRRDTRADEAGQRARWAGLLASFAGVVLPVLGLIVPYSGLTLGLAGLLSVGNLIWGYLKES
jgi:hypothetical protein